MSEFGRDFGRFAPQGAPRGLLVYWMLQRISKSPTYGYEILTEISEKTEGAWRPGAGSVYPMLKKLVSQGYVDVEKTAGAKAEQRTYKITSKGMRHVTEAKEMFQLASSRWTALRGIFIDLIEPERTGKFVVEGSRKHFEMVRKIMVANRSRIPPEEFRSTVAEYSLLLERELAWTKGISGPLQVARSRRKEL